ncbi:MAG: AbrB/MazE/SpoVT family DNA-binding domain-containing protein [Thaumarchaeota archaeon]|nr:AbrB/MazE/SpoVT family DNA-binding domain-containing protein [Nitrososphaerota archaeon]
MREEEYTTKIVRVGERGQIVIPKAIRKIERIKPKDTLKITNVAGTITIKKVEKKSAEEQVFQFIENSGLTIKDWRDIKKARAQER